MESKSKVSTFRKKILVLDLDNTLLYSSTRKLPNYHFTVQHNRRTFFVRLRPRAKSFLKKCIRSFRLGIWSASSPVYVNQVVKKLCNHIASSADTKNFSRKDLAFVYTDKHCRRVKSKSGHIQYVKPLSKIYSQSKYSVSRDDIFILDDTPSTYQKNRDNAVPIRAWWGRDGKDRELDKVWSRIKEKHLV